MKVLTAEQMRQCDRATIDEYGIPDRVLMENAGTQVVESIEEFFAGNQPELVAVLCGKGNNGGDGLVVARHLHNLGRAVRVYLFAAPEDLEGVVAANHEAGLATGVEIIGVPDSDTWREYADELVGFDCIVDALLGTGISGAVRGHLAEAIDDANASGAPIVAIDLPSGLSADSGEIAGPAIDADLTVTFAAPKLCHAFAPACELCGELGVVDIGIPPAVIDAHADAIELVTPAEVAGTLAPREVDTHKGTYGHVLIVAGAVGTAGAAVLTARGALRCGAGLVTVATPDAVYEIVAAQLTEALVRPHPSDAEGGFGEAALAGILELAKGVDVVALGPGIGTSPETTALVRQLVAEVPAPLVIDADGLNAFTGDAAALGAATGHRILSPHPGEASRLLGRTVAEVQSDRVAAARDLALQTASIVVLKGYRSLICDASGRLAINPTGNPGMATGGSGDVLTGMIAALVGQGVEHLAAARVGAFLHGEAGDLAAESVGEIPLIASDIVAALPAVLQRFDDD